MDCLNGQRLKKVRMESHAEDLSSEVYYGVVNRKIMIDLEELKLENVKRESKQALLMLEIRQLRLERNLVVSQLETMKQVEVNGRHALSMISCALETIDVNRLVMKKEELVSLCQELSHRIKSVLTTEKRIQRNAATQTETMEPNDVDERQGHRKQYPLIQALMNAQQDIMRLEPSVLVKSTNIV